MTTNPGKPNQSMDEELVAKLKYLRLGRLLSRWDETLETARQGRYSAERLLQYVALSASFANSARCKTTSIANRKAPKPCRDHQQVRVARLVLTIDGSDDTVTHLDDRALERLL